jgi:hypothetical protein
VVVATMAATVVAAVVVATAVAAMAAATKQAAAEPAGLALAGLACQRSSGYLACSLPAALVGASARLVDLRAVCHFTNQYML